MECWFLLEGVLERYFATVMVIEEARSQMLKPRGKPGLALGRGNKCHSRGMLSQQLVTVGLGGQWRETVLGDGPV